MPIKCHLPALGSVARTEAGLIARARRRRVCGASFLRVKSPMPGLRQTPKNGRARLASCLRNGPLPCGADPSILFSTRGTRRPCEPAHSSAGRWPSSVGMFSPTRSICRWRFGWAVRRNPQRKSAGRMQSVSDIFERADAPNWRPCGSWRASAPDHPRPEWATAFAERRVNSPNTRSDPFEADVGVCILDGCLYGRVGCHRSEFGHRHPAARLASSRSGCSNTEA